MITGFCFETDYQYHLQYKLGVKNANTDGLSRLPLTKSPAQVPIPGEIILSMKTLDSTPVTAALIAKWTARDRLLSRVVKFVLQGWPTSAGEEFTAYSR